MVCRIHSPLKNQRRGNSNGEFQKPESPEPQCSPPHGKWEEQESSLDIPKTATLGKEGWLLDRPWLEMQRLVDNTTQKTENKTAAQDREGECSEH